ncbi:MAG TPA: nucleotide-binding protein [Acidimicrobiales bacterium]|nr:nucleotide-binding protein [Acidimicrobiales bacterium]
MSAILLIVPRVEAEERIAERIDAGEALKEVQVRSQPELDRVKSDRNVWRSYNKEMLRKLFSSDELASEYEGVGVAVGGGSMDPQREIFLLHRGIDRDITRLRAILAKLELYDQAPTVTASVTSEPASKAGSKVIGKDVFIVHGRAAREQEVARYVESLGLKAVILQEKLHGGSATLIEKLEREARPCGYAIVVYTGDDEGRIYDSTDDYTRRARENVVLELGYFVGLLGRDNVTILREQEVTIPSDFHGVGWYDLDAAGAWRTQVQGELKRAALL